MKKFIFVILACLTAALFITPALAKNDYDDYIVRVKVTNKTDAKVFIAFANTQTDSGGEEVDNPDSSKGWWGIDPGETKIFKTYDYSPFFSVFYYATSMNGKRVWAGKKDDHAFWIHPTKAFNVTESRKVKDGKRVYFRRLKDSDIPNKLVVLNLAVN